MLGFSSQRSSPHSHSYTRTTKARRTSEIIAARRTSPLHFRQWGGAAENDGSCALSSTLSPIAPLSVATVPAWCSAPRLPQAVQRKSGSAWDSQPSRASGPAVSSIEIGKTRTHFDNESFQGVFDNQSKRLRDCFVPHSLMKSIHEAARNCEM